MCRLTPHVLWRRGLWNLVLWRRREPPRRDAADREARERGRDTDDEPDVSLHARTGGDQEEGGERGRGSGPHARTINGIRCKGQPRGARTRPNDLFRRVDYLDVVAGGQSPTTGVTFLTRNSGSS